MREVRLVARMEARQASIFCHPGEADEFWTVEGEFHRAPGSQRGMGVPEIRNYRREEIEGGVVIRYEVRIQCYAAGWSRCSSRGTSGMR